MNIYHTIRAFLEELIKLPFCIIFTVLFVIGITLESIGNKIEAVARYFCPYMNLSHFNIIKTYKIVKSNEHRTEFHKWTGKRIK